MLGLYRDANLDVILNIIHMLCLIQNISTIAYVTVVRKLTNENI